jgi:two-component system NtrC family sensor kinase
VTPVENPQRSGDQPVPRILIAEDDPAAASVLETLLRLSGYEVIVTRDGAEALRALEDFPTPDVILLDWMLPEVSGVDVCRAVRERWDPVALPILMVTARTDAESIAGAFDAGANDYLTKPFLGSELRARIASHLRVKQLQEERRRIDEHLMEREKLSSLGVLVSSVAHDLNNPLAGIMGHAQLLLEDETDPERLGPLNEIMSEVQRCGRIIGDLLGFARRHPADARAIAPAEVLAETLALRERHLRAMGVRVETEIEADLPPVRAVAHQLQQVFLNVLINAEQALRDGGDSLRIRLSALREYTGDGNRERKPAVEIVISNNGPPIPPETLPHIFEPFFTTKPSDEGTGLGLAICARIVQQHGGNIEVRSSADEGTSFRVTLPALTV